jgi:hypothetical protein
MPWQIGLLTSLMRLAEAQTSDIATMSLSARRSHSAYVRNLAEMAGSPAPIAVEERGGCPYLVDRASALGIAALGGCGADTLNIERMPSSKPRCVPPEMSVDV